MDLKNFLKENNKSYTEEREIIFSEIQKLHHFDYSKLQKSLEKKNIKIGRASIFRTLNLFLDLWLVESICNKSGVIIYEYTDENNHHEHLKCKNCWMLIEFDDSEVHKYLEKIAKKYDFKLLSHSINLEWLCKKCRNI